MSDEDLETLGLMADRLDNAAHAAVMPLPPHIHVQALTGIVGDVRDELKTFLKSKGFDPWQ